MGKSNRIEAAVTAVPSRDSLSAAPEEKEDYEQNTEPEPTLEEFEQIGELTFALSDLSVRVEKDEFKNPASGSKGLRKWILTLRPMIHGRFMWCLTIANLVLFVVLVLLFIYLAVFGVLAGLSYSKANALSKKIDGLSHCSVQWTEWSNCSAKCHEKDPNKPSMTEQKIHRNANSKEKQSANNANLPMRSRYVIDVTGAIDKCPPYLRDKTGEELKKIVDFLPCNVWSCTNIHAM